MMSHPEVLHFELQLIDLEVPTDREGTEVRHFQKAFLYISKIFPYACPGEIIYMYEKHPHFDTSAVFVFLPIFTC